MKESDGSKEAASCSELTVKDRCVKLYLLFKLDVWPSLRATGKYCFEGQCSGLYDLFMYHFVCVARPRGHLNGKMCILRALSPLRLKLFKKSSSKYTFHESFFQTDIHSVFFLSSFNRLPPVELVARAASRLTAALEQSKQEAKCLMEPVGSLVCVN